jgi:cobalamin biosynthesis protein CbiG
MTGAAIEAEPAVTTSADSKGYAVTEHVRRYYRTAKV